MCLRCKVRSPKRLSTNCGPSCHQKEKADIEEFPTHDLAAYDLFIQGKQIVNSYLDATDTAAALEQAVRFFEEAVARDPRFVLAYANLSRAHSLLYFLDLDPTPGRLARADDAVRTALRFNPNSGEAHLALAEYYFRGFRDYTNAMAELAIAHTSLPNSVPLFLLRGYIERRQGHWPESEQDFVKAVVLDPRSTNAVNLLVDHYVLLRQFAKAIGVYDRAIAALDWNRPFCSCAGPTSSLPRMAKWRLSGPSSKRRLPHSMSVAEKRRLRILVALAEGDYARARQSPRRFAARAIFRGSISASISHAPGMRPRLRVQKAINQRPRSFREGASDFRGTSQGQTGGRSHARRARADGCRSRRAMLSRCARRNMPSISCPSLATPMMARSSCKDWRQFMPGPATQIARSISFEKLLKMPGYLCYGYLLHDPQWAPLRGNPRFDRLVRSLAPAH